MNYFLSTDDQIKNVKSWNKKYKWGFSAADFKKLPKAPERPKEDLVAVVLVPYLKTIQQSFDGLCKVLEDEYDNYWRWNELKKVRLLDGITRPVGLRWEVIDFGANRGKALLDVRTKDSPHIGVLVAAAHFKDWVQAMDGDKVPYVWLPGLQAEYNRIWQGVPILYWDRYRRKVGVDSGWDGYRDSDFAVPVFRESSSQPSETKNSAALGSLELPEVLEINGQMYRKEE